MKRAVVILLFLFLPVTAMAQSPEEKGLAIALEQEKRDSGWGDSTSEMEMVLRNRHGDESLRQMRTKTLEVKDDGDRSLLVFQNPRDVKGTALLTWSHRVGNDDRWLYLPALKRVKRISSSNQTGSFMGSEFTYEDLGSREVEKYNYKRLRDVPCPCDEFEGATCFVSESYPMEKESGYTRIVGWIDRKEYRVCKAEFWDRKGSHLKTLYIKGYRQYLGKYWRASEMEMVNHQSGKSTTLRWKNYRFRNGFKDSDFNRNALKRAK